MHGRHYRIQTSTQEITNEFDHFDDEPFRLPPLTRSLPVDNRNDTVFLFNEIFPVVYFSI